ncbi:putative acetylcholine receptor chaperone [Convolutriloba macropyga]|uniref:putative acetylcholine receptor chaperone n=1 Tax=Convolutriloba macropyga TaxID=536237 RepID=UPI003F525FAC
MAAAKSVKMLSVILGLYFLIMGVNKLGPWFSQEMHKSLKAQHKELFKGSFFKLVVQQKLEVPSMLPSVYRQMMAFNEAFCGLLLLMFFLPLIVGNVANIMLLLQYLDYLCSNLYLGNKFDKSGSVAVFLILLVSRLVLVVLTKDSKETTASTVQVDESKSGGSSRADLEDDGDDEDEEEEEEEEPAEEGKGDQAKADEPKKVK